jgi:hypothetical protein
MAGSEGFSALGGALVIRVLVSGLVFAKVLSSAARDCRTHEAAGPNSAVVAASVKTISTSIAISPSNRSLYPCALN